MVKICDSVYINHNELSSNKKKHSLNYEKQFSEYPYELDHFQKYAVQAIEEGHHVLVTAHTGSGKSMPCEHAIRKFCASGKKVIYTSPIKSLSNQKFAEFSKKYPEYSFGILTGDIKFNPEADVIIMTTEILRNTLFRNHDKMSEKQRSNLLFDIDIENDLACVVFDEVHYINDADRGKVWEECIIQMPQHVQMVMLSATIDKAPEFAQWIETTKDKEVWLTSTNIRVVPLEHQYYYTLPKSAYKQPKSDKVIEKLCRDVDGKCITVKSPDIGVSESAIQNIVRIQKAQNKHAYKRDYNMSPYFRRLGPQYVLNEISMKLKKEEKLPAICFVFSRAKVEYYGECIEHSLFDEENNEEDRKKSSTVTQECEKILMKLPNYKEYIGLPEFKFITKLLSKGVAIHHSGMMPVFREMIEHLFDKGYVKMLFATETFAVGVNMPTKTVLFTNLSKYTNGGHRGLLGHEYTQMAGRAGRRGLDTRGYVIHLMNMIDIDSEFEYKRMLSGTPQRLVSKFDIDAGLILRLIHNNVSVDEIPYFITKSMMQNEISREYRHYTEELNNKKEELEKSHNNIKLMSTPMEVLKEYDDLNKQMERANQKKRKIIQRKIDSIYREHRYFEKDYENFKDISSIESEISYLKDYISNTETYVERNVMKWVDYLVKQGFIVSDDEGNKKLSLKGTVSSFIQEVNPLVFGDIISNGELRRATSELLMATLSAFISMRSKDEHGNSTKYQGSSGELINISNKVTYINNKYYDSILLDFQQINEKDFEMNFTYCDLLIEWFNAKDENECDGILKKFQYKYSLPVGEVVKCIMKIINISKELQNACMYIGDT